MKYSKIILSLLVLIVLLGGTHMDAVGFLGFGNSASWKEEVLLHDGSKIIVKRSQNYGGRHEIGQPPPIKEHSITFSLPGATNTIMWTSEYGKDIGRANFNLLALHVLNGTPYIVASPNLCLSYNKWGRPNPPYVFFKYDGKEWQRISLEEFPAEFKTINVALDIMGRQVENLVSRGFVSSEKIKELNQHTKITEFKTIIREPLKPGSIGVSCPELIYDGKGGWLGIDWFTSQPSYKACMEICNRQNISDQYCPCKILFKGGK
ncbi:MAG: hypothetical protein WC156_16880 [Pedobacter sp.]